MCRGCWDEVGRPGHTSPEIERAVVLIGRIYQTETTGGPVHVYVDDWNVEDAYVPFTVFDHPTEGDWSPDVRAAAEELVGLLNRMPEADRFAALAHADGFTGRVPIA